MNVNLYLFHLRCWKAFQCHLETNTEADQLALKETKLDSPRYGLNNYFPNWENDIRLSGLRTEACLLGMLDAVDFKSIDIVSPFL